MDNYTVLDIETTGATNGTKGNPYNVFNRVVLYGTLKSSGNIQIRSDGCPEILGVLVGVNCKFDLAWRRRNGGTLPTRIWDCQYAQFCILRQQVPWLSLNDCLKYYGYPPKLDVVKTEYWDKGIDTDQIPLSILKEYLEYDLVGTEKVYKAQLNYLQDKPQLMKLILLGMEDILYTFEMEWNGLHYDLKLSFQKSNEIQQRISEIDQDLLDLAGDYPINWASNDHLSAILFGGTVKEPYREEYTRTLKSGEIKNKARWSVRKIQLPSLIKPKKKWAVKKEGYYSTNEETLIEAKKNATKKAIKIIDLLLERSKLEKLDSSYFTGIPKLYHGYNWKQALLHGQFNHCITRTGRISSQKPNLQNIADQVRECLSSRFC